MSKIQIEDRDGNVLKVVEIEIVERGSGYYLVDRDGVVDGPFETLTEAQTWFNKYFKDY